MNVPETWQLVRLSSVCTINPPLAMEERPTPDTPVSFIPMAAVDEIEGKITRWETRIFQDVSKGFTPFRENDVLFAKITPSMENGKAAIAADLKNGLGFGSTEFHVLRPTDHLSPDYLLYFIRQPWFRNYARTAFVGSAGQQRVPQDFLERVQLPLPTLLEQQRIVSILRQAEGLRRLRHVLNEQVSTLRRHLFDKTFPNFDNPEETILLGSICIFVTSGSRDWSRYYSTVEGDPKFIRVQNIKAGELDFSDIARVKPPSGTEADRARAQVEDLIISITGSIGQAALVSQEAGECYVSQHVALVRTDKSLPPRFLAEYLNHPAGGQQQINRMNYGQTKPGLNLTQIQKLRIPIFDAKQMNSFIVGLAEIAILERTAKEKMQTLDQVFQEIVARAFSGEISALWRGVHRHQWEIAARARDAALGQANGKTVITEYAPPTHREVPQSERYWLTNHLGSVQGIIWEALQEWRGTLIPSEDLDAFRQSAPRMEQIEDANDHILRALSQLAGLVLCQTLILGWPCPNILVLIDRIVGATLIFSVDRALGFIAQVSVPNQQGEYVTGYRGLREGEHLLPADLQLVVESQR